MPRLPELASFRLTRADLLMLSQCILIADAQAILTITVASPHPNAQIARKLALVSMIFTLATIVLAVGSTDVNTHSTDKPGLDIEAQEKTGLDIATLAPVSTSLVIERSIKILGLGATLTAFILFIAAPAAIPIPKILVQT
ncbi:hypothetical protein FRB90_008453 [Tulasnella sp. 427]|nr:hypothetical protein FRB90_008453 [Tulasnella sp. 427]